MSDEEQKATAQGPRGTTPKLEGVDLDGVIEASLEFQALTAENELALGMNNPAVVDEDGHLVMLPDPTIRDALVNVLKEDGSPNSMYDQILLEITTDLAYLRASRDRAYNSGESFASISEKRFRGLKSLAETIISKEKDINKVDGGRIDFKGAGFRKVFDHFLQVVAETMGEAEISDMKKNVFFAKLQTKLKGFENQAQKVYLNSQPDKKRK